MRRSKKRKLRAEELAVKELKERKAQRAFVAAKKQRAPEVKFARRSVRKRIRQTEAAVLNGLMVSRGLVQEAEDIRGRSEDHKEVLLILARQAIGDEVTPEDRDVLRDFLQVANPPPPPDPPAPDAGTGPDVQPGG